jgi:exonuclease-1
MIYRRRKNTLEQGNSYLKSGQRQKAIECFETCVDITPKMAREVIIELKKFDIEFIVAPYEADAQLAYLESIQMVDGVVTEDSDLLVFGCKYVLLYTLTLGDLQIGIGWKRYTY